ncbi:MAG: quinol:cytochrome C oxidoreductase [Chitinophagaceae bacterium]|nr:MAG: quinol:cytochrome C oxidoreductase [Chitinophagaceae bacterium]
MSTRENFIVPKKYNMISFALMAVGILAVIALYVSHGSSGDQHTQARFWGSLLQNSVYFLLVVNAAMFFICATTLAWGGWQLAFGRVTEAVSACVPVIGVICGVILLSIVFGDNHEIYHWSNPEHVAHDATLQHKSGFLNPTVFAVATVLTIVLWSLLGWKMRRLSRSLDNAPIPTLEGRKKYIWKNTVWAALFIVVFALTVASTTPWFWLMSIDAHWYSTMYSWYTFASTFVAGIALVTLFVVFVKNAGYLEYTNREHLHDLGKFMFAFSIFWTYLWFSQFMLIWYANIPEETVYFKPRTEGAYTALYWLMFAINFLAPLLILMSKDNKRKYSTITFMCLFILFGHWLDFFQMVFPGFTDNHVPMILYDFGIGLGFVGVIMFVTGRALGKAPLLARNHPFIKESLIHHT